MKIAFLGTGLMGAPMARRLLKAGHEVAAWNRTRAKAQALQVDGATIVDAPTEAVSDAELVISVLENGPVTESVLFAQGAADAAKRGVLFVDMSSIAPELARSYSKRLIEYGHSYLDAPVSGGPSGAEVGDLAIMVGGDAGDFRRAEVALRVMGRPTLVGSVGAGQFAKLTSQMIASTTMSAVAEALLLARSEGIDPLRIREALAGGFADSKILQMHGLRMVERDFIPGGHVHTFIKDLTAARSIVEGSKLELPVTTLAFELFHQLSQSGAEKYDIAAMALEIERRNPPHRIGQGRDKRPEDH